MQFRRQTTSIAEVLGRFVHSVWLSPLVNKRSSGETVQSLLNTVKSVQFSFVENKTCHGSGRDKDNIGLVLSCELALSQVGKCS